MYLIREESNIKTYGNTPRLSRQSARPITQFASDYEQGFRTAYKTLMKYQQTLLSDRSPLFCNKSVVTRYLFYKYK